MVRLHFLAPEASLEITVAAKADSLNECTARRGLVAVIMMTQLQDHDTVMMKGFHQQVSPTENCALPWGRKHDIVQVGE